MQNMVMMHLLIFLHFIFFSEFLKYTNQKLNLNELLNISLIGIFVILNKITLVFILIIPFVYIFKHKFVYLFKKFKFYLTISFAVIWIVKNIIVSGCLIYPIQITCINSLAWTDPVTIKKISLENEAFYKKLAKL